VVGGFTAPRNTRPHLGALLLGYFNDQGKLIYAGHTGGGRSEVQRMDGGWSVAATDLSGNSR
jgi:hypothetical protein